VVKRKGKLFTVSDKTDILANISSLIGTRVDLTSQLGLPVSSYNFEKL
jgi:hypothetical protein